MNDPTVTLRDYMQERGWSSEDLAAVLAERGVRSSKSGRPITPRGVSMIAGAGKPIPLLWRPALELDGDTATPPTTEEPSTEERPRRQERPPQRPGGAPIVVEAGAAKRIAGAYRFAGAALAAGSGSQGVAHVWDDSADKIAELWLAAAQENPWAARFVNMMQAGGPMGDLAAGHLYLAGATLYVLGASIPGGDAIFARYSRHRPVVDTALHDEPAAPAEAGAADGAAPASVV